MKIRNMVLILFMSLGLLFSCSQSDDGISVNNPTEQASITLPPTEVVSNTQMGPYSRILKELQLTREQQAQFHIFLDQKDSCLKRVNSIIRNIHIKYDSLRKEIFKDLRDSLITKEEARKKLLVLNKLYETEIRKASLIIFEKRKYCEDEFNKSVMSILDNKQKEIWKKFLTLRVKI